VSEEGNRRGGIYLCHGAEKTRGKYSRRGEGL